MRGAHAKRSRNKRSAAKDLQVQKQFPKTPGDMAVKGKTKYGRFSYAWEGLEVEAMPRVLRPELLPDASAWTQARARESTPERALRNMVQKARRRL